jgi:hypoxanthine-DNA glycosylase
MRAVREPVLTGLPAVVDRRARLLILGSFPGQASLAAGQYYAHRRNQFWSLLGRLLGEEGLAAMHYADRLDLVRSRGVAIWDAASACRRAGSLDSAMRDVRINRFSAILSQAPEIGAVAFNGRQAAKIGLSAMREIVTTYVLPSTSPAHAGMSFETKLEHWMVLRRDGWIGQ